MPAQTGLTQPIAPQSRPAQPTFTPTPRPAGTSRQAASGSGGAQGRRAETRRREPGGWLSRIWQGSLSGRLAVCVIACSALIGAVATMVTRNPPGSALGLFVLAGTVAAALTVQPRTGRLIFPVPALSYLIASLAAGAAYDHSTDKTELLVGATQWIASGFFVMVLATLLAVALTTVRWFMWRRDQRDAGPPRPQAGPAQFGDPAQFGGPANRRAGGSRSGTQPTRWGPDSQPTRGWDQRSGPRPRPGPGRTPGQRPPGSGPYNFSSGA